MKEIEIKLIVSVQIKNNYINSFNSLLKVLSNNSILNL